MLALKQIKCERITSKNVGVAITLIYVNYIAVLVASFKRKNIISISSLEGMCKASLLQNWPNLSGCAQESLMQIRKFFLWNDLKYHEFAPIPKESN